MNKAQRICNLQPYLFAQIEQKIEKARQAGKDVISLGIGDPDLPTPDYVVRAGQAEMANPANHQYPSSRGMRRFRQAVANYYRDRFGVSLDPDSEVCSVIGSKEGIGHISMCYTDPGTVNLVPDPGYPVYSAGTLLAGGIVYSMPLLEKNGFLPDLTAIPTDVAKNSRILFLNYPNNPTGACATDQLYRDAIEYAKTYGLVLCHDAAYAEISFEGARQPSLLEYEGAREVGLEFGSLSKIFNMTGWRVGWAVGNPEIVGALATLKSNLDSGVFQAVQHAAIAALEGPWDGVEALKSIYKNRRDQVVLTLRSMGWSIEAPKGSIYVWAPVPEGFTSAGFAEHLFDRTEVVVAPGNGYGQYGEGYFRISLTVPDDRLSIALQRMKDAGVRFGC